MPDQKEKATGRVNDQQPDATAHDEMNAAPEHMAPPATDVKQEPLQVQMSADSWRDEVVRVLKAAEVTVALWSPFVDDLRRTLKAFDERRAAYESANGEGVGG